MHLNYMHKYVRICTTRNRLTTVELATRLFTVNNIEPIFHVSFYTIDLLTRDEHNSITTMPIMTAPTHHE